MIYSRTFDGSKIGSGGAATSALAPSGPSGRGELPPVLHQCPTKFEIANGEAFENPARVLGCAASECMSRPSGRLQLAPAGHVRSIVNSVRERVRACVRNAREILFFRREGRPGEFLQSASRVCLVRVLALPNSRHHGGQSPHTPGTGRTILRSKV